MLYNAIVSILGTKFIIYIIMSEANTLKLSTETVNLDLNRFSVALLVVLPSYQTEIELDQIETLIEQYHKELDGLTVEELFSRMSKFYEFHGGKGIEGTLYGEALQQAISSLPTSK
jgi:cell division protein FtsL